MNYGCNLRPGDEKVTQTKEVNRYASVKTIKQVNVRCRFGKEFKDSLSKTEFVPASKFKSE